MEIKRTMTVDTEMFEVGDVLAFALNDGEKVQAMAVEETPAGMLFVLVDCLNKEYPMFEKVKRGMSYMTSDLRRNLNGEILARFPEEIKSRMVAVNPDGDLLRIPTEREIFGENPYGEPEDESVARWKPMELRRNRIAFQGDNGAWEWYWLMNRCKDYASYFAVSTPSVMRPPAPPVTLMAFARSFSYPKLSPPCGASAEENTNKCIWRKQL